MLYPHTEYREPFLGGGSLFLGKSLANINWLNDKDEYVYNFWKVVQERPNELCNLIMQPDNYPTVDFWLELKNTAPSTDSLWNAFRFLFFNRTNYSGIHNANPIGGIRQNEDTTWKVDCRWNAKVLCDRIQECSKKLQNANITSYDFEQIITAPGEDVLMILDPPYYHQGKNLYRVSMSNEEHEHLALLLKETNHKFLLTIDNCDETRKLYSWAKFVAPTSWTYTINSKKKDNSGKELLVSNFDITEEAHFFNIIKST